MKVSWLLWSIKCQNLLKEVVWRFTVVKLNKIAKLSVPFPNKVPLKGPAIARTGLFWNDFTFWWKTKFYVCYI